MTDLAKCFILPNLLPAVFSVAAFLSAYVFYLFFLFLTRNLRRKENLWGKMLTELRYPFLFLLFELAAIFSFHILTLPDLLTNFAERTLNVFMIATFGWLFIGITRALYNSYVYKLSDGIRADYSKRTIVTQLLFLYRLTVFAILAITVAAILLTFPYIKSVGIGILGSAGIVGIALGIAARPILLNLMAGMQIAINKTIKMGDALFIEGEFARVESIHLTHVITVTWDARRFILPISYFIDKPFQNWDITNPELLTHIFLYCDYTTPIEAVRKKAGELIETHPCWNKKTFNVQVIDCTESTLKVRILASVSDAGAAAELQSFLREKIIDYLQKEYPNSLPLVRNLQLPAAKT